MPKVEETVAPVQEPKMRMIEITVDRNITVIRRMVPQVDIEEGDIPLGGRILSHSETAGIQERADIVEDVRQGHRVHRKKPDPDVDNGEGGNVVAVLKSGRVRVQWDNGSKSKEDIKDLSRIW